MNSELRQGSGGCKRIDNLQPRKTTEVAVARDDLGNAVFKAKRDDVSVVNQITCGT